MESTVGERAMPTLLELRGQLWRDWAGPRPKPPEGGILLCLSGGGFRAAAFHLGAVRRLIELGLFESIKQVRSVSGGSIFAAHCATMAATRERPIHHLDYEDEVAAPFREFLRRDLRTFPILVSLPVNWMWKWPRVQLMERRLRNRVSDLSLVEVDSLWHFIASELGESDEAVFSSDWRYVTGQQWFAVHGSEILAAQGLKLPRTWTIDSRTWPLARVALASAAFPPVFGPVFLPMYYERSRGRKENLPLALSDGGVLSNLGLPRKTAAFSRVLISDASYPPQGAPSGPLKIWWRFVIDAAIRRGDTQGMQALYGDGKTVRWSISPLGGVAADLARIRTDLDSLSAPEIKLLENAGYLEANRWIVREDGFIAEKDAPVLNPPHPEWLDDEKAANALCGSGRRFIKARRSRRLARRWRNWRESRTDDPWQDEPYFGPLLEQPAPPPQTRRTDVGGH